MEQYKNKPTVERRTWAYKFIYQELDRTEFVEKEKHIIQTNGKYGGDQLGLSLKTKKIFFKQF